MILLPDDGSGFWDVNVIEVVTLLMAIAVLIISGLLWSWHRWKSPLRLRFLIPQARYAKSEFRGAGNSEILVEALRLRPGTYTLMFQVDVKREIDIVSASMDFVGEGSANLPDLGPDNLWIVAREQAEIGGSPRIMNWHGHWLNPVGSTWPAGEPHYLGHKIHTAGAFEGHLVWTLRIRGHHAPLVERLGLNVHDGREDDVPFLKAPEGRE